MIYVLLSFWIFSAVLVIKERRIVGMIVYLGIFSVVSSVCFLYLGAPDVAMAEAAVSTFSTIFLVVCFEKYFSLGKPMSNEPSQISIIAAKLKNRKVALVFTVSLLALFMYFMPKSPTASVAREMYIERFKNDVGGENSVTAVYLGYRIYDTLFEALMLLVSVAAVSHMSWYSDDIEGTELIRGVGETDKIAIYTIRIVCPIILLFGIYLILNGHISPGGGFQGGVAIAAFFICRYLIYNIGDVRFKTIAIVEKLVFASIVALAACFILLGLHVYFPEMRTLYLLAMNTLIGMKVACGFMVIFYRYIAFERR